MKAKHIFLASALVGGIVASKELLSNTTQNIAHQLKIRIPIEKLNLKWGTLQNSLFKLTAEFKNNYYQDIEVEGINITVYAINANGSITELGSSIPNTQKYLIRRNAITNIKDIKIQLHNLNLLTKGIANLFSKGQYRIIVSGYAQGFPFKEEISL